ncbi:DUF1016 family protein [Candidatus Aerophobetes bacterium]|nr:DUF1016 family protein [Candidatus Aerophobetes bacterium]
MLEQARRKTARQVNTVIRYTYWKIGKLAVEEEQRGANRAQYGGHLLQRLARDLTKKFGKGFTETNLKYMRQFYLTYPIRHALRDELTWTHYRLLLGIKDGKARSFYEIEVVNNSWSTRELDRQINSLLFERLTLSKDKNKVIELAKRGQIIEKPEDAIKDPYVLEFLGLPEQSYYTESQLEQKLIDHLQEFILELGKGFAFVARQKRITIDNEHYYIDLVFYHRILRCLVLFDLKVGKLSHSDVGQMNFYLNYVKDREIFEGESFPVGIILCTKSNRSRVFVEYALGGLSNSVFVSKYKLYLPTKKELEIEVKKESARIKLTLPKKKGNSRD